MHISHRDSTFDLFCVAALHSGTATRLLDDVITQTIGERLIGEPLNADSNTDERRSSAGGSIGSGSIHRFSGEEMAEILAPGKHVNNAKLRSPNKFLLQDQIPDPLHDSDDDDVSMKMK